MRIKLGNGKAPIFDLQVSDILVALVLVLIFGSAADAIPLILRYLK